MSTGPGEHVGPVSLGDLASAIEERLRAEFNDARAQTTRAATPHPIRAEVEVEGMDAPAWLAAQGQGSRGYWSDRDTDFELAGIGRAEVLTGECLADKEDVMADLHRRLTGSRLPLRYFGGARFGATTTPGGEWSAFKAYRFVLPRFEVMREGRRTTFACNAFAHETPDTLLRALAAVSFPAAPGNDELPRVLGRLDEPDHVRWGGLLDDVLADIGGGAYDKLVLARRVTLRLSRAADSALVLQRLKAATRQRFCFCFQPAATSAFVGASPERLYRREGARVLTEAIAGTRPRGATAEEDRRLRDELTGSEKERREQAYVVDGIRGALQPLCESLAAEEAPRVLALEHAQHLVTRFQAALRAGVRDTDVLRALHPTAAVGGTPTAAVLPRLDTLEPFDRGWYAGPVGWLSRDKAQFAVGIRSALLQGERMYIYSGAGVVAGSTAAGEWDEVESKIGDFLSILNAPCGA